MHKLVFLWLSLLAFSAQAQEFNIENYQVRWSIIGVGNTELRVMKNAERTYINVYRSNGITSAAARMSADDAVQVADALRRTEELFTAQQGSFENVSEKVTAGNFTVTFRTSVFNGFTVVIQENDQFSTNAVTLPYDEAVGIRDDLAKAPALVAFLNSQVGF